MIAAEFKLRILFIYRNENENEIGHELIVYLSSFLHYLIFVVSHWIRIDVIFFFLVFIFLSFFDGAGAWWIFDYFSFLMQSIGRSGHVARQYFPYVSSESDLQRYKAISFRQNSTNVSSDQHGSSTLSASEYRSDRVRVRNIYQTFFSFSIIH